jgi:hypothetical protein
MKSISDTGFAGPRAAHDQKEPTESSNEAVNLFEDPFSADKKGGVAYGPPLTSGWCLRKHEATVLFDVM